jgi:hypothetical protein
MRLIDLDGNTWDGTKLNSKYKPVYDSQGRNEMMGVTLGWLYDAPEFDLEKNNVEIRNKAIDDIEQQISTLYEDSQNGCEDDVVLGWNKALDKVREVIKAGGKV